MTRIVGIGCRHVKGIENLVVDCDFYPNKPNFLVAPNGSGKSSLAVAFASLNSKRLKLADSDRYNNEDWDDSSLSVTFDGGETLNANADVNETANKMDVQVIRSGLYANMTNRRVGPRVLSQTKMSVQQCVLYDKVPATVRLDYSVKAERRKYPSSVCGKMSNLAVLFNNYKFLADLLECSAAFNSTTGSRYCTAINEFFKEVIRPEMDGGERGAYEAKTAVVIASVKPLEAIKRILDRWRPDKDDTSNYLDAVQINRFIDGRRAEVKAAWTYLRFCGIRDDLNKMIPLLNRTRYEIKARVKNHRLVVEFPDWDDASNGEIDVLQLCVALFRARARLGEKENSLLLIDEIFDYLDDANLLVAQHFLLEMMRQFRVSGKNLYVVILTHLDPSLFKSFRFREFHISYISSSESRTKKGSLQKLLVDRARCKEEQKNIYEEVSSHYLHFSECDSVSEDVLSYLSKQGIGGGLIEPAPFRREMETRLCGYFSGKSFAASEVCCGIRIAVERLCYEALRSDEDRTAYLGLKKGTEDRLRYAEERGVEVPEAFHLLGSIYNSCMHLSGRPGEVELVRRQLENNIIRRMIESSLKELGWGQEIIVCE